MAAAVSVIPEQAFPPRNLVSVTGLIGDNIVSVTVYRQVGTGRTPVRAASDVDVTGTDVLLRIDGEQPFGVPVTYVVALTDTDGTEREILSGPVTTVVDGDVVSDAVRGIGALVRLEAPLEFKRDRAATVFNVGGRNVVVGQRRSRPTATLALRTETGEDGDDLNTVLDGLTEGVLLLRTQTSTPRLDGYYALLDDNEAPRWFDDFRWWTLDVAQSEPWADALEASGYTLQDIADAYTPGTLQDLADDFPGTLLDIALNDWGG